LSSISNARIYGLEESMVASGYPMATKPLLDCIATEDMEKAKARAAKLGVAPIGSGHDQFLTSIIVQFDLTFPLKAWVELQRYHFVDFCSSMSTMHRITQMDIKECCNQYVDENILDILSKKIDNYNENPSKENFYQVIYNIPSGFEYTARLTTNYRQLKTIYSQRKNHRLPDWHVFCKWIRSLPHSEWITGETNAE
jgi:hypothetical protein